MRQFEMPGERAGDCAFAARRRPIDGDDNGAACRSVAGAVVAHKRGALTGLKAYGKAPAACRRPTADAADKPTAKLEFFDHGEARVGHQAHLSQMRDPFL